MLLSVVTDSEALVWLKPMADGLMKRYLFIYCEIAQFIYCVIVTEMLGRMHQKFYILIRIAAITPSF